MLSVNNLTYSRHDKIILSNLTATFNDGEIIGITGAAGSGKSTFINLLNNKNRDYEGSIFIDDLNIRTAGKKIKNKISHYSQSEEIFNPEAIVKEWILGGRIGHKRKLSPYTELDKEIAIRYLINFGLSQLSESRLKLISETSKRMAALARVFSAEANVLLLEKPETGLNIGQKVLLSKCIKKYTSAGNIVILTSSDLNFIAGTCDRIVVIADTGIAESGTHRIITGEFIKKYFMVEAVVTKNIYSGLPEIQIIEEN